MENLIHFWFKNSFEVIAVVFSAMLVTYFLLRAMKRSVAPFISLLGAVVGWGMLFSFGALIYVIAEMVLHQLRTGFDPNQGSLAWIFLHGPFGFLLGMLFGFVRWLQKNRNR